jgi:heptosyltransferase-2
LKSLLIHIDYFLKNTLLQLLKEFFWLFTTKTPVNRILIFRTGSLGDSICALPAIHALREAYPNAVIDILTSSGGFADISLQNILDPRVVNTFYSYEGKITWKYAKKLKNNAYDVFILLPQTHSLLSKFVKDLFFARWIKARQIYGFTLCVTRVFASTQAKSNNIPNIRDFLLQIACKAGAKYPEELKFPLKIEPSHISKVEKLFQEHSISNTHKTIAFTIGAKRTQNRWPLKYFDEVISFALTNGFRCLIIGGNEDKNLVQQLKNKENVTDLTGELSVMESAVALSKCRLHITNDTGPMHLAYAVGTYVIALFSSRDYPNLWYPPKNNSTVFRNNSIYCSECFSNSCPGNRCMREIVPSEVIEIVKVDSP